LLVSLHDGTPPALDHRVAAVLLEVARERLGPGDVLGAAAAAAEVSAAAAGVAHRAAALTAGRRGGTAAVTADPRLVAGALGDDARRGVDRDGRRAQLEVAGGELAAAGVGHDLDDAAVADRHRRERVDARQLAGDAVPTSAGPAVLQGAAALERGATRKTRAIAQPAIAPRRARGPTIPSVASEERVRAARSGSARVADRLTYIAAAVGYGVSVAPRSQAAPGGRGRPR
jgi:hypothetical protein